MSFFLLVLKKEIFIETLCTFNSSHPENSNLPINRKSQKEIKIKEKNKQ